MGLNVLKLLIESACADGVVTEREKVHLIEQAKLEGISENKLNQLIDNELKKVKDEDNNAIH